MFIAEIFYSIQGEGELTGVPSVFIRTSGCNLRCSWCDTKYASWQPEGEELSIDQIMHRVMEFSSQHCVITGGEPMLAKDISKLASRLKAAGKHITIETAATLPADGIVCDLASLSPKLSNSTPDSALLNGWSERHEHTRLRPRVISDWIEHYHFQLKFVVATECDLQEVEELLSLIERPFPPSKVMLMPEGTDIETVRGRSEFIIDVCKRRGYRYCNRLHLELFGNSKGT